MTHLTSQSYVWHGRLQMEFCLDGNKFWVSMKFFLELKALWRKIQNEILQPSFDFYLLLKGQQLFRITFIRPAV